MNKKVKHGTLLTVIFTVLSLLYLYPIVLVFINSFKKKAYISKAPFEIPTGKMYVGLENYIRGIKQTGLIQAFGWSLFITILSVVLISCRTVKAQCGFSLMRDTVTKMDVYQVVDEFPSYPGGGSALLQYVGKHYRVPENDVQSTFNLTFVVDKTGKLKGVRIHKKNRKEYSNADNAMIKVFNSMPAWKPGICNGKKVNVLLTQRINVHLE